MSRRREGTRGAPDSMQSVQEPHKPLATAAEQAEKAPSSLLPTALYHSLDLGYVLSLVFGGCCAYEIYFVLL